MKHFEGPSSAPHEHKAEHSIVTTNALQIEAMKLWAAKQGATYATSNELALAWVRSGNAKKYRDYIEEHEHDELPGADTLLTHIDTIH